MNPYVLQRMAEERIADRHREAAAWRLANEVRSSRRGRRAGQLAWRPWRRRSRGTGGAPSGAAAPMERVVEEPRSEPARFLVIARIPAEGVETFADYERMVIPLLADYGGVLKRRLVNFDRTIEAHLLEFVSGNQLRDYSNDPRRLEAAPILQRSGAEVEVVDVLEMPFA